MERSAKSTPWTYSDVRLGVDIDPACEHPFSANNAAKFLLKSVENLKAEDLERVFRKNGIRLLAG
jgi:DNA (cytosine-5)-methyltransferase 1